MKLRSAALSLAIILGAVPALAADGARSHAAAATELTLDRGQKWPTDGTLRRGMSAIRALMAEAQPHLRAGRMDATGYAKLSDQILILVNYTVANCRLLPEVDAQIHLVLARIAEGAEAMTRGTPPEDGVAEVEAALKDYATYFSHPGWQPL